MLPDQEIRASVLRPLRSGPMPQPSAGRHATGISLVRRRSTMAILELAPAPAVAGIVAAGLGLLVADRRLWLGGVAFAPQLVQVGQQERHLAEDLEPARGI